jgi:hypothetical protein
VLLGPDAGAGLVLGAGVASGVVPDGVGPGLALTGVIFLVAA